MKNHKQELFGRMQRQYHQRHQWRLGKDGLYVPHSYAETKPDSLSWWDDVGFILNGRRVIVWWQHPRYHYSTAIEEQSWDLAGPDPQDDWLFEGATTNYKQVGKSRKKIISYTSRQPSAEQDAYYENLRTIRQRMEAEGIDLDVSLSWKRERLNWATGVGLVVPLEVRNEAELAQVASLARRLLLGQATLQNEFPDYRYDKADWLSEQEARR
ncbi:MAG: hypothetical protein ABIG35_01225 [Pseudomonadota bacterium]